MNLVDILLLLGLAVILFFALRSVLRRRKKGGCGCGCEGCSGCGEMRNEK